MFWIILCVTLWQTFYFSHHYFLLNPYSNFCFLQSTQYIFMDIKCKCFILNDFFGDHFPFISLSFFLSFPGFWAPTLFFCIVITNLVNNSSFRTLFYKFLNYLIKDIQTPKHQLLNISAQKRGIKHIKKNQIKKRWWRKAEENKSQHK